MVLKRNFMLLKAVNTKILLNLHLKKIYAHNCSKKFLSYRIRKGLCYSLSKPEIDECGKISSHMHSIRKSVMSKCSKLEINVITNGTSGTSSIFLDVGAFAYLFNCGENVIRARSEIKHKVHKLHGIFVTSGHWRHLGGILGTLTSQQRSSKELLVLGPPEIRDLISIFKANFLMNSSMFLKLETKSSKQIFDDGILKIKFVPLFSEQTERESKSTSKSGLGVEDNSEIINDSEDKKNNSVEKKCVLNYICQSDDFSHHLNFEACLKKKVPVGPLLKLLKEKQDIVLENGDVVCWQDVSGTSTGPETFVIADCPSIEYLEPLLNEKEFVSCQSSGENPANLIIHFTPSEVMKTEKYYKWMSLFPSSANHLVLNTDNSEIDFYTVHDFHKKLHFMSQNIFPSIIDKGLPVLKEEFSDSLWRSNSTIYTCQDEEKEKSIECEIKAPNTFSARKVLESMPDIYHSINGMNVIRAIPSLTYCYHPKTPYDWHFIACHNLNTIIKKLLICNELEEEDLKSEISNFQAYEKFWMESNECLERQEYPKIIFLGTGSGEPARRRAPSGIIVYLNENEVVLLDCGEGIYVQMCRFFGSDKVGEILNKIVMIFVSHFHTDHHIGLHSVLHERLKSLRKKKSNRKLVLILPPQVKYLLLKLASLYEPILQDAVIFGSDELWRYYSDLNTMLANTTLGNITVCNVPHCNKSFAISFRHKNGYKITYSGDTQPCNELAEMGRDSDILIHEATFGDDLEEMAHHKKHCTVSQAIEVGIRMKAKYILLTHFSQRYASVPLIDYETLPKNVVVAFDFMVVNEKVLPLIEKLTPLYKRLFARELQMLEKKGTSKLLKRRKILADIEAEEEKDEKSTPIKTKKNSVL